MALEDAHLTVMPQQVVAVALVEAMVVMEVLALAAQVAPMVVEAVQADTTVHGLPVVLVAPAQFALSGPVTPVPSHQHVRGIHK